MLYNMNRIIFFFFAISISISLIGCVRNIFKESVSETVELGTEKSFLKFSKEVASDVNERTLIKAITKKSVNEIVPVGLKSLDIIESKTFKGKFYPALNNLGELSKKYDLEFNMNVLRERRKAISPFMQFLTTDNIDRINLANLSLGLPSDAKILKRNMLASMDPYVLKINNAFGGAEAHHIIEGNDPSAKLARDILKKFDLDINHPINGIFLPQDKNSIYKGTLHKTSHTKEYSEYVYQKIKNSKSKMELIKSLTEIKYELYNGKIKLEGPLHAINKNDINL